MSYTDYLCPLSNLKKDKFLKIIFLIQLLFIGLVAFDFVGINIPILRQLISFIYLSFIPGLLLLRLLKVRGLSTIETIIYSSSLSIAIILFSGYFMNLICPIIGIYSPITFLNLFIVFVFIVSFEMGLLYFIEKGNTKSQHYLKITHLTEYNLNIILTLCLIPFLSIFGTYLSNYYNNTIILFILILIISILPILTIFFKIDKKYYTLIIWIASISLLLHWSLNTNYLLGGDIHYEYYFANLVNTSGFWNSQIPQNLNAMLSVVILPPIFSKIANIDLIWVFKIIYPLLFSLVPVGLYFAFKKQANNKIALLSVFYFMFVFPFFSEMVQLARQEIAELFLVAVIMLFASQKLNNFKSTLLVIIFGSGIVISHYGLSYIFILILGSALFFYYLFNNEVINSAIIRSIEDLSEKIKLNDKIKLDSKSINTPNVINLRLSFVLFIIVLALGWYIYNSGSSPFNSVVHIGDHVYTSLTDDFLQPDKLEAVTMIVHDYSGLHLITKYLYLFSQGILILGVLTVLLCPKLMKFNKEFISMAIGAAVILFLSLILPNFASSLNTTRLFHITLMFLAPFTVIGIIIVFKIITLLSRDKINLNEDKALKFFAIFSMIFLLFTSGFMYEIMNDDPVSIALNNKADLGKFTVQDYSGAGWIWNKSNSSIVTISDTFGAYLLDEKSRVRSNIFTGSSNIFNRKHYLFFVRSKIVNSNQITLYTRSGGLVVSNTTKFDEYVSQFSRVYSNGGSDIYGK